MQKPESITTIYMKEDRIYFMGDHLYEWISVKRRWWQFWKQKCWMEMRQVSCKPKMVEWSDIGDYTKW